MRIDEIARLAREKATIAGAGAERVGIEHERTDAVFDVERPIALYREPDRLVVCVRNGSGFSDTLLERAIEFEACALANHLAGISREICVGGSHPFRQALGRAMTDAYSAYHASRRMAQRFGTDALAQYQRESAPGFADLIATRVNETPEDLTRVMTILRLLPQQAIAFATTEETGSSARRVPPVLQELCAPFPQGFSYIAALPRPDRARDPAGAADAQFRNAKLVSLLGTGMFEHTDVLTSYLDGQIAFFPDGTTDPLVFFPGEITVDLARHAHAVYAFILGAYGARGASEIVPKHLN